MNPIGPWIFAGAMLFCGASMYKSFRFGIEMLGPPFTRHKRLLSLGYAVAIVIMAGDIFLFASPHRHLEIFLDTSWDICIPSIAATSGLNAIIILALLLKAKVLRWHGVPEMRKSFLILWVVLAGVQGFGLGLARTHTPPRVRSVLHP